MFRKKKKSITRFTQASVHLKIFMKEHGLGIKRNHKDLLSDPDYREKLGVDVVEVLPRKLTQKKDLYVC